MEGKGMRQPGKRKVFITGTSSGLGFALAEYYLESGCSVYGISKTMNRELKRWKNFFFLAQDIAHFKEVETNLFSFLREVKRLDLVVLNAGILSAIKDLKDTPVEEIQKVMDVNVWANKILIDALFKQVKVIRQVVAVSSGASVSGQRGWNAYALSKATLNMLIQLYARECPDTHFCSLAPGLIDTKMQEYISGIPEKEKYPVIKRLKAAKGTALMPSPPEAAKIVSGGIEKALDYESGIFIDVRNM